MKISITDDNGILLEIVQVPDGEILKDPQAGRELAADAAEAVKREALAFRQREGVTR